MVVMSTVASFAATLQAGGIECDSMGCDSTGCKGVLPPHSRQGPRRVIIRGVITRRCRSTPQSGASTVPVPYFTRFKLKAIFYCTCPVQLSTGSSLMAI